MANIYRNYYNYVETLSHANQTLAALNITYQLLTHKHDDGGYSIIVEGNQTWLDPDNVVSVNDSDYNSSSFNKDYLEQLEADFSQIYHELQENFDLLQRNYTSQFGAVPSEKKNKTKIHHSFKHHHRHSHDPLTPISAAGSVQSAVNSSEQNQTRGGVTIEDDPKEQVATSSQPGGSTRWTLRLIIPFFVFGAPYIFAWTSWMVRSQLRRIPVEWRDEFKYTVQIIAVILYAILTIICEFYGQKLDGIFMKLPLVLFPLFAPVACILHTYIHHLVVFQFDNFIKVLRRMDSNKRNNWKDASYDDAFMRSLAPICEYDTTYNLQLDGEIREISLETAMENHVDLFKQIPVYTHITDQQVSNALAHFNMPQIVESVGKYTDLIETYELDEIDYRPSTADDMKDGGKVIKKRYDKKNMHLQNVQYSMDFEFIMTKQYIHINMFHNARGDCLCEEQWTRPLSELSVNPIAIEEMITNLRMVDSALNYSTLKTFMNNPSHNFPLINKEAHVMIAIAVHRALIMNTTVKSCDVYREALKH